MGPSYGKLPIPKTHSLFGLGHPAIVLDEEEKST